MRKYWADIIHERQAGMRLTSYMSKCEIDDMHKMYQSQAQHAQHERWGKYSICIEEYMVNATYR